jgi:carboxypeptidase C (cathepsin A)
MKIQGVSTRRRQPYTMRPRAVKTRMRIVSGIFFTVLLTGRYVSGAAETTPAASRPAAARAMPGVEHSVPVHAEVAIGGQRIGYTATAAMLDITDSDGKPTAKMFYVAYVADQGRDVSSRPVTFAFNGGPGNSSALLHLAAIGPLRIDLSLPRSPLHGSNAPVTLEPNHESMLDRTDLVFIDAVGTGYSHAVGQSKDQDFWGIDQDIDAFASAIQAWLQANHRWNSPVALIGESYGGQRAATLAAILPRRAVRLGGVILVSPGLSVSNLDLYSDAYFATLLPSYAATAWYHERISPRPASLELFLDEVRAYSSGPYLTALAQGRNLSSDQRRAVAKQLAYFTGLETSYILRSNLRVNVQQFAKELLRPLGRTVAPLDARQQGIDVDQNGAAPETDSTSITAGSRLAPVLNDYLERVLRYPADRVYRYSYLAAQDHWDWMRKVHDDYPWVSRPASYDLATAVQHYPNIKVITLLGYFDLAVGFFENECELAHLPISDALAVNFTTQHYYAGHMMYDDDTSRRKMKHDLDEFYDATFPRVHP